MLGQLLKLAGPGGVPFIEYLGLGLKGGTDEALTSDSVVYIEGVNGPNPRVTIQPRDNAILTRTQVVDLGLERARLLPHAVGSAVSTSPQIAYELVKPILDLANAAGSNFRRGDLPRVTGRETEPSLAELIQDYIAGANIAAGFPEPPPLFNPSLLGPVSLGALSQLWGYLGGRGSRFSTQSTTQDYIGFGTYSGQGRYLIKNSPRIACTNGQTMQLGSEYYSGNQGIGSVGDVHGFRVEMFTRQEAEVCSGGVGLTSKPIWKTYVQNTPGGPWTPALEFGGVNDGSYNSILSSTSQYIPEMVSMSRSGTAVAIPSNQAPPSDTAKAFPPDQDAVSATAPGIQAPNLQSAEAAQLQQIANNTTTTTITTNLQTIPAGSAAANASTGLVTGSLPALPAYLPAIGTALGTQTGTLPQTQPAAVPITPATAVLIGSTLFDGATAATSLVAIGQEVLRIEKKLEAIMQPGNTADIPWLDLLTGIANAISILSSANTYTMVEVCPPDGQPPEEYEWEVPGVPVVGLGLAARLDALAEMLQVHKNLKQPVCRTVPQGQPVTVQFVQSESEWETPP